MRLRNIMITALAAVAATGCWATGQPQLTGAKLVERSAKTGVQAAIQEIIKADKGPAWIAYSAPVIPGEHHMCCYNFARMKGNSACCGSCRLDSRGNDVSFFDKVGSCQATLASVFFVFMRFENGSIGQVRAFSTDCAIDAPGSTVYWLQDVEPGQSIAYLESLLEREDSRGRGEDDEILSAIALHAGTQANAALERLVQPGQPSKVRGQAAFWIGSTRGGHGLDVLFALIKSDQDREFLEQAIFAVSQNEEHERAFNELIRLARKDPRHDVREHALFWLAQEAGQKAAGTITDAIENDPDTDVKKKAVFALSEMPHEEGVPLLIDQARKNRNPVVRKEAIFWLGQSEDPRALDFIASILEH
jgi:HEAT repeat protein